jgi:tetratricopeptide (TPR) repeat protein
MTDEALDPDSLAALEDQRDFLLRSLADLERERVVGDLDDRDYTTLRDDYTARAAEVLRAIEERREAFASNRKPRRMGRLVVSGVAVVALAVCAGVWVAQSSGTRNAGATITGNAGPAAGGGATADTATDTGTDGGGATVAQSPASACIPQITTKTLDALKCFQKVLDKNPDDATALTYRGWALTLAAKAAGTSPQSAELVRVAETSLKKAVQVAPKLGDPRAFLAILYLNTQRCDDARAALAGLDALKLPSDSQILQLVNTSLRPQLTNGAGPAGSWVSRPRSGAG